MIEITFEYLEEHFHEIMNSLENEDQGFLVILPDGDRCLLLPYKNKVIDEMEDKGLIQKYE